MPKFVDRRAASWLDTVLIMAAHSVRDLAAGDSTLASLLSVVPTSSPSADSMDVDASAAVADEEEESAEAKPPAKEVTEIVPEQDVYLRLLSGLVLLDTKDLAKVRLSHRPPSDASLGLN